MKIYYGNYVLRSNLRNIQSIRNLENGTSKDVLEILEPLEKPLFRDSIITVIAPTHEPRTVSQGAARQVNVFVMTPMQKYGIFIVFIAFL